MTDEVAGELALSRNRTTAMLHMAPDAVIGVDHDGVVSQVNNAALELFRAEIRDLLGLPLADLLDGEWRPQLVQLLRSGGGPRVLLRGVEWVAARADSTNVPVEVSLARTPIDDQVAYTAFVRDVSDRVADRVRLASLVTELQHANRQAEEASRAKSDFLSRMSHELRTPLNAILGFAELLELEASDLDAESVDHIGRAGRHLLALVEDVLDISRIEAGGIRLELGRHDPERAVQTAVEMARRLADEHGATIEVRHPVAICDVLVDERRLVQVIVNLVTNGVKYGRPGGTVVVDGCRVADRWRITVSDDGPGIPADRVEAAFEPFERLGAEGTAIEGTGVGLALTRQLVHAMDGGIRIESEPGAGATVHVELPVI
ncbi:MAG: ATP-binding protein [Actinomycetota bacterium]